MEDERNKSRSMTGRTADPNTWTFGMPRCDFCDNGLNADWAFCPYCSRVVDASKAVERAPEPLTTERAADPTPEALEAARKLLAEMCIEWNEQDDDCAILANALDAFSQARVEAAVEKERELVLAFLRNEQTAWRITADSDAWRYNPDAAARMDLQAQAVWRMACALADAIEKSLRGEIP